MEGAVEEVSFAVVMDYRRYFSGGLEVSSDGIRFCFEGGVLSGVYFFDDCGGEVDG